MREINSLNYDIIASTNFSFWFLNLSSKNFRGSTTIFYVFCRIFLRNSYLLNINGTKNIWPINSKSDFRLLRGDYIGETGKYSLEIGYEGVDISFLKTLVKEGDFIIDIGANKGFYTLFFSSYIKENGKIISIEASKKNFAILFSRITNLWNLTNVLPFNFILGNSNFERVDLKKPSFFDDGTGFYFKKSNKNKSPFSRTLDNLLNIINFKSFKLLKIDVEGAEVIVLNGEKKFFR
jgi:FkbM family methyltransferase